MASPIESYLGQLRKKLETRFDSECADELLSEIRAHLSDAASDLEEEGLARLDAEKLSISRFGAPEKAAFLMPWGQQYGTGDRYWGRGAFWIAIAVALGLTWYAFDPFSARAFPREDLRPLMTVLLTFYAYACWRARSFAMVKQSAVVVGLFVAVTSLLRVQLVDPSFDRTAEIEPLRGLVATRDLSPEVTPTLNFGAPLHQLYADLGATSEPVPISIDSPVGDARPSPPFAARPAPVVPHEEALRIPGTAPFGQNPWVLAEQGALPEVSQLLLSWLFLILMTNAAVCWIGCLEHEQKGGVTLVQ